MPDDMSNIISFKREQFLTPTDLKAAADAFEDALRALPEAAFDLKPFTARQLLARHVMERALAGERDVGRLRASALRAVSLAAAKQAACQPSRMAEGDVIREPPMRRKAHTGPERPARPSFRSALGPIGRARQRP
jgi:hypothetical protein